MEQRQTLHKEKGKAYREIRFIPETEKITKKRGTK